MRRVLREWMLATAVGILIIATVTAGLPSASSADVVAQRGLASWYGPKFHGRKTASGETFDQFALTAAHRKLPLGTVVMVTNLANGKKVEVEINDRGPHARGRIIDLSRAAAGKLGFLNAGTAQVRIDVIGDGQ